MSHEYYILFYSIVFTNPTVNPRSHEFESKQSEPKPQKRNKPKPQRESNPKLEQRFPLFAALYPQNYREVVAAEHKMTLKNPLRHLQKNRPRPISYFAVIGHNGKIDTTIFQCKTVACILEKQISCQKFVKVVLKVVKSLGKNFNKFIIWANSQ